MGPAENRPRPLAAHYNTEPPYLAYSGKDLCQIDAITAYLSVREEASKYTLRAIVDATLFVARNDALNHWIRVSHDQSPFVCSVNRGQLTDDVYCS